MNKEVLAFPFKDAQWIKKAILFMVMSPLPGLNFLVFGYLLRVLQMGVRGEQRVLPCWSERWPLFRLGVIGSLSALLVVSVAFGMGWMISSVFGGGEAMTIVLDIWVLLFYLLIPLMLASYVSTEQWKDFFHIKKAMGFLQGCWKQYSLLSLVALVLLLGFAGVITALDDRGWFSWPTVIVLAVITAPLVTYFSVVAARLVGEWCAPKPADL